MGNETCVNGKVLLDLDGGGWSKDSGRDRQEDGCDIHSPFLFKKSERSWYVQTIVCTDGVIISAWQVEAV